MVQGSPLLKHYLKCFLIMEHILVLCNSKTVGSVAILLSTNCFKCWIITRCGVYCTVMRLFI